MASHQVDGMSYHSSSLDLNLCPQCPEAFKMQVNRPASDVAAAGKGNLCTLIFAQKGPYKIVGSPDPSYILIIYFYFMDIFCVKSYSMSVNSLDPGPDLLNGLQKDIDIFNIWKIIYKYIFVCHNRSRQNAKGSILRSADRNLSHQRIAAFHNILFHPAPLYNHSAFYNLFTFFFRVDKLYSIKGSSSRPQQELRPRDYYDYYIYYNLCFNFYAAYKVIFMIFKVFRTVIESHFCGFSRRYIVY